MTIVSFSCLWQTLRQQPLAAVLPETPSNAEFARFYLSIRPQGAKCFVSESLGQLHERPEQTAKPKPSNQEIWSGGTRNVVCRSSLLF